MAGGTTVPGWACSQDAFRRGGLRRGGQSVSTGTGESPKAISN
jgi:hypothetical protein